MFGIPFEGDDYYSNGKGGMKGVIAKSITLFDQTGPEMDKACLATFLAECLFEPSVLLEDYIKFEKIDDYHVSATISYGGQKASGIKYPTRFSAIRNYPEGDFIYFDGKISSVSYGRISFLNG